MPSQLDSDSLALPVWGFDAKYKNKLWLPTEEWHQAPKRAVLAAG